ncbi:N-acetyltransferase [Candidatus Poribacteria bacterium]|nr:N-acetyltransferase [Candidatus Poribacteria bacterium]
MTVVPARIVHAPQIHRLISYWAERTPVLPKSLGHIYENLREFVVALDGEQVVGCAAMHIDWADLAEVRSVAVAPDRRNQGIGQRLVEAILRDAEELGIERVFCLTDQVGWFARLGFNPIDKAELPHKVWRDCMNCPIFTKCTEVAMGRPVKPA